MKPQVAYKHSGLSWIGPVPTHWEIVPTRKALHLRKDLVGDHWRDTPLLSLTKRGVIRRDIDSGEGKFPASFENYQLVLPDDLVFCLFDVDETPRTIGRVLTPGMITGAYSRFTVDRGVAEARFLEWYYLSIDAEKRFRPLYTGLRKVIQKPRFLSAGLALPPLDEQRVIADFLDSETARIDTLIAKQEPLIATLRERRAATVESAVAHVQAEGPRLKHVTRAIRQGWSPQCYAWPADGVEKWGVLKAGAVNGGRFRPTENKELPTDESPRPDAAVREGDLIVSRANTRDLVGSAAAADRDYPKLMLSDKLYAFTLHARRADPRFVAMVLGSRRWRDFIELEATGASPSMLNVSQADILNLPMRLPTVEEQHNIVTHVNEQTSKIDALIEKAERFIELSRERRSALITAAVTGQIDVRGAA